MEFSTKRLEQVAELLAKEVSEKMKDGQGIEEMEQTMRELVKSVAGLGLQKTLEQSEARYIPDSVPCSCGRQAQFVRRRKGVLWTVFGKVSYKRSYYLCPVCHQGKSPLDQHYGLRPGQATPGLSSLLGILGVEVAFEEASRLAERFLLFRVSDNTVRKQTEGYGEAQEQVEEEWIKQAEDERWLQERERSVKRHAGRIYASMDGAHVPVEVEWRELKTLCWYDVEKITPSTTRKHHQRNGEKKNGLQARDIHYYCDIQEAEEFGRLFWATGLRHQADQHDEIVVVADGAIWIWNLVEKYFPQAVQIVDWYHAVQYLTPIAATAWGSDSQAAQDWLNKTSTYLWKGKIDKVIRACRRLRHNDQARESAEKAITYYTNNAQRMHYKRFRKQGYLIGSGTIESACKQIASARLKRSGAHWTLTGAIQTAKARAAWLSKTWDTLRPPHLFPV